MLIFIAKVIMNGLSWFRLKRSVAESSGKTMCRENSSYYVSFIVDALFNISVQFQVWQNILGMKNKYVCVWITVFYITPVTGMKIENMRCFNRQQANTPQNQK